ncbi:MAG: MBL fold metallo-hydrolase RNA specificity domain-containing protein [Methylococcales bacterium]
MNLYTIKTNFYLIHGEKSATLSLQTCFQRTGWNANIPKVGEKITL